MIFSLLTVLSRISSELIVSIDGDSTVLKRKVLNQGWSAQVVDIIGLNTADKFLLHYFAFASSSTEKMFAK